MYGHIKLKIKLPTYTRTAKPGYKLDHFRGHFGRHIVLLKTNEEANCPQVLNNAHELKCNDLEWFFFINFFNFTHFSKMAVEMGNTVKGARVHLVRYLK